MSIRTKIFFYTSLLIVFVYILGYFLFINILKKQHLQDLKRRGVALAKQLSYDSEIISSLILSPHAFEEAIPKKTQLLKNNDEISYWRILNSKNIIHEEVLFSANISKREIPSHNNLSNVNKPIVTCINSCMGNIVYDFFVPVFEKRVLPLKLSTAKIQEKETLPHIIGFIQIGLHTKRIDKKMYDTLLSGLIPTGVVFILGGICIVFFLTKRIMSPLQRITEIMQEIARGNFSRSVSIQSHDEIGLLAMNVNTMTKALESSYHELKQEIERRKASEAQLILLIDRDPLTNLFNRRRLHNELKLCIEQTQRYGSYGALMFLDLDNFKQVNDTLGHQKGDELLVTIARLLRNRLRQLDLVARIGGDEFAIILPHTNEEQAQLISEQILESIITATEHLNVTASIGIALFPGHGIDANALINCADMAMYKAKQEGRNRVYIYSMEMTLLTEV